jgi:hypothetical protein
MVQLHAMREQNNGWYEVHLLVIDIIRYHRNVVTT